MVGHTLKAQANYDRERLRRLPVERSDSAIDAVVGAAFSAIVKERFHLGRTAEMVVGLAGRVAASSRNPLLDETIITSMIEGVLNDDVVLDKIAPDLALHAKVLVFVQAVEDLGCYDREVDDILRRAEEEAEARGISLTRMYPTSTTA